jgi:hypothetical protein
MHALCVHQLFTALTCVELDPEINQPTSGYSFQSDGAYYKFTSDLRYALDSGRFCWSQAATFANPHPGKELGIIQQSLVQPDVYILVGAYRPTVADDAVLGTNRWPNMSVTFDGKQFIFAANSS